MEDRIKYLSDKAKFWEDAHARLEEKLRVEYMGRICALEEWLKEYRDDLKKTNVFHKNQGTINAINELLNGNDI